MGKKIKKVVEVRDQLLKLNIVVRVVNEPSEMAIRNFTHKLNSLLIENKGGVA